MALLSQTSRFLASQRLVSMSRISPKLSSGSRSTFSSRLSTETAPQNSDRNTQDTNIIPLMTELFNKNSNSSRGPKLYHSQHVRVPQARTLNHSSTDREHNYEDHNHNHGRQPKSKSKNLFWPLLGLALFTKGSSEEISESERKRLAEKIKKMTPIERIIARGVLFMSDQEFDRASDLFHEALHMARVDKDSSQETLVLNLLATNYFESGDLESAKKLFVSIIQRMILDGTSTTDTAVLEISLKLASIYSADRDTYDRAMTGYNFVIDSLLDKLRDLFDETGELKVTEISDDLKNEIALLGWSYDWFAKHLIDINHLDKAIDLLKRALSISSVILGPTHDQTLILYNDIGTALAMNNSPREGKSYILNAVEGAIKSQSKELASFYVNLALVNLKLQQTDDAKRYCEYSMELASKNRDQHNSLDVIKLSQHCLEEVKRLSSIYNK